MTSSIANFTQEFQRTVARAADARVEEARARALEGALAQALAQAQVRARARKLAKEQAQALERARVLELAWARAREQARARGRRERERERAQAQVVTKKALTKAKPTAYSFRYDELLADSDLKNIIYSIEPSHRRSLARYLWHRDPWRREATAGDYWWLIQIVAPIARLPPELLHQIFLDVIGSGGHSPLALMRVSKVWYTIVTGIWASLRLGTTTPKDAVMRKLERSQWFVDVLVDTENDRGPSTPSGDDYQAIFAAIQATSRWRSFVVETFPPLADLPEHIMSRGLQLYSGSVMNRLETFKIKCACEMSPLLICLLSILGRSATGELTTVEINSANVISFLFPTYSSVFRSVTVLSLDTPGLPNPVDLLPHLYRLETLTASHLILPAYHSGINLPLVHTLRHLSLRAASIQWMSGRIFHALKTCTIFFPLRHPLLHTFRTTFPNCDNLSFEGHPLDILEGISANKLTHLSVMSSCSYRPRGSLELARFSSRALQESRLAPRILHISIEATNQAWTTSFAFMSTLEELVIHNTRPSSLGVKALQALVVHRVHASNPCTTSTPKGWNTPLCPSLKRFGLRYHRWLRQSEHFDLVPVFMSVISTRQQSEFPLDSFRIWMGSDQKRPLELIERSSILWGSSTWDQYVGGG